MDENELQLHHDGRNSDQVLRVYDLSEFVFCPRAGLIANESSLEDSEDEEPLGGPRLGGFWDYSEHRFSEEISRLWNRLWLYLTLLGPSVLLVMSLGRYVSPMAAALGAIPLGILLTCFWLTLRLLISLVQHRNAFRRAPPELTVPTMNTITMVNWWSLRKSGFECSKPELPYCDEKHGINGKPWRILTHGVHVRIPVTRKHRGVSRWQPQHVVRLMAYCQLLELCEAAESPFGILMFRDSEECVLIPNTLEHRQHLRNAIDRFRRMVTLNRMEGMIPETPEYRRCLGCHLGEPREYVPQQSETFLNGSVLFPVLNGNFHSTCGDRFHWQPPHEYMQP